MVKPNTSAGKLSWRKQGVTGAGTWRALGIPNTVPFVAPERKLMEHNTTGSTVARQRYVQQVPKDVTIEFKVTNWAFVAYCLQSDPLPAALVRTFVYKVENVGALVELGYSDGTIRYTAQSCAVKRVVIKAGHGEIPTMEVTFSVPKIIVDTAVVDAATLLDWDVANEVSILDCDIKVGGTSIQSPAFSFTIEPNVEHGNVVGEDYHEAVNFGNVAYTLEIEGYYDSTVYDFGAAGWSVTPAITYIATVGDATSENYFQVTMANPVEMDAEFELSGDEAVKMTKTLRAAEAPTMTAEDAVFAAARYWTV